MNMHNSADGRCMQCGSLMNTGGCPKCPFPGTTGTAVPQVPAPLPFVDPPPDLIEQLHKMQAGEALRYIADGIKLGWFTSVDFKWSEGGEADVVINLVGQLEFLVLNFTVATDG